MNFIDQLIIQKAEQISYNKDEISNIKKTSNHLRGIINNQTDFSSSHIGGSYKRGTLVKGISDIDIYYEYIKNETPEVALYNLREYLINTYPKAKIKQDTPSILVDFNRISFNITPYKTYSNNFSIPGKHLKTWKPIGGKELEHLVLKLRLKDEDYIKLIKILKYWNLKNNKGIKNYKIEEQVCNLFINQNLSHLQISDWLRIFLSNKGFRKDSDKINSLITKELPKQQIKNKWLKFIENK